jgi:hypothetical protein
LASLVSRVVAVGAVISISYRSRSAHDRRSMLQVDPVATGRRPSLSLAGRGCQRDIPAGIASIAQNATFVTTPDPEKRPNCGNLIRTFPSDCEPYRMAPSVVSASQLPLCESDGSMSAGLTGAASAIA